MRRHGQGADAVRPVRGVDALPRVSARDPLAARRRAERRPGAQPNGARRAAGRIDDDLVPWAPLFAAPLDVAVSSTPEVDALDPAFWRARLHGVLGGCSGTCWTPRPSCSSRTSIGWTTRRRIYCGSSAPSCRRSHGSLHHRRPGRRRLRGRGGITATARDDAAARGAARGGREDARRRPPPAPTADPEELESIAERAAGNPLFLQELASPEDREGETVLPETVEALVATKIDRLAPADRALLRWASVLGISFSGEVIAQVLEGEEDASPRRRRGIA